MTRTYAEILAEARAALAMLEKLEPTPERRAKIAGIYVLIEELEERLKLEKR